MPKALHAGQWGGQQIGISRKSLLKNGIADHVVEQSLGQIAAQMQAGTEAAFSDWAVSQPHLEGTFS